MKSLTTRLLLFLSMPLLLLCACHTTCPVGPQGSSQVSSESALQPLALPEDACVLAFDGAHIFFCRQENTSDESAYGLYRYDVASGETVHLLDYRAPVYSGDAAVLRVQDLYLLTQGASARSISPPAHPPKSSKFSRRPWSPSTPRTMGCSCTLFYQRRTV